MTHTLRADLHVHTWASTVSGQLPFLRSRDCYSAPLDVYRVAKARGMDLVAITDHDSIDGALELLDRLPDASDVIVGEEVSCRFPDGDIEVHLGVYGMTEQLHRDVQPLRKNVFDVTAFLRGQGLFFSLNHLLHFYRGQTALDNYLRLLDEVPGVEARNGTMVRAHNELVEAVAARWQSGGRRPLAVIAGSDAHTLRRIGRTWTVAPGRTREDFVTGLKNGLALPGGSHGGTWAVASDAYVVIAKYVGSLCGMGPVDLAGARRTACLAFSVASLPFQFLPLVIVGSGKMREMREVEQAAAHLAGQLRRMLSGECGLRPVSVFETDGYRSRIAAEVDIDAVDAGFSSLERRRHARGDRIGLRAAAEAIEHAGLLDSPIDRARVGIFFGSGTGDLLRNETFYRTWLTSGIERARPSDAWNHFTSTPVDAVAARFGFEGPRACVVAACASSAIAIGRAVEAVRRGRADVALAGGTDALARLTFTGFNLLRLMDPEPCRPFDRSRAGMNIGEGAGVLVLEDLEHARRRGATILAEVAGHSLICEAFHPTAPEPEGRSVASLVQLALEDARLDAAAIDHINAHGTATPQNDAAESRGFQRVLRGRVGGVPVTSIKSMVGHCLGASGAVEAAVAALTVARGVIPPTIHHQETDAACPVDVVANQPREAQVRCAVSTSLGFGGNDSAIVLRAFS